MAEVSNDHDTSGSVGGGASAGSRWALVARDLVVRRGSTTILEGLSCRVARGETVAILGPNGCGKTTLSRVLLGQMFATSGEAWVLGERLGATDVRALRRRIGIVNPTTDMGPGGGQAASYHSIGAVVDAGLSALEAVCTGYFATVGLYDRPSGQQRERAAHWLGVVGLGDRLKHRVATLSTGEVRRCLLARALVRGPELLILDEPTAGLDIAGRERVLATIEALRQQPDPPAIVMITHHVEELSPGTSRVLLMRGGRFLADGPPEAMVTPEMLSATFGCKVFVRRVHGRWWLEVLPEAWLELMGGTGR